MSLFERVTRIGKAATPKLSSYRERREASCPSAGRALRRALFKCFLRGRPGETVARDTPASTVRFKLLLGVFAGVGCVALGLDGETAFERAVSLHSLTFALVGMLLVSASGSLSNRADAEILLHRPVSARTLLRAQLGVLVQIAWSFAFALNLVGFWVGARVSSAAWEYVLAHAISTALEAAFCAGVVMLVRERSARWQGLGGSKALAGIAPVALASSMAAISVAAWRGLVVSGRASALNSSQFWLRCLPPAWFAGIDGVVGSAPVDSGWPMIALAVVATCSSLVVATRPPSRKPVSGQSELSHASPGQHDALPAGHRLSSWLDLWPLRVWLHDPVVREMFLFTARRIVREPATWIRLYAGLLPILMAPLALLLPTLRAAPGADIETALGCALAGGCLPALPVLGMKLLGQSCLGLSADIFRVAPLPGPGKLCDGARRAVVCCSSLPVLLAMILLIMLTAAPSRHLPLLLPGAVLVPVYSRLACTPGRGGPLCFPSTGILSALAHGARILGLTVTAFAVSGLALAARLGGWFWWLMLCEALVVFAFHARIERLLLGMRWSATATRLR